MRKYIDSYSGQLQRLAGLYQGRTRKQYGREIAEGPQAVREVLAWCPERVRDVYITEENLSRYREFNELTDGIWTHIVPDHILNRISPDCQGIIADVGQHNPDFPARADLAVLACEMTDPGNAGTLIRTADAAGADWVAFGQGSVDVTSPKVIRSAAGSSYHLPVHGKVGVMETIECAKDGGMRVLAADGNAEVTLGEDVDLSGPTLWVFGNEARGLTSEIRGAADEVVAIPMRGRAESLNVSIAASICLYASVFARS